MVRKSPRVRWVVVPVCVLSAVPALAQTPLGTAFTYQGRLTDAGAPANGAYDLQFTLYDAASAGNPVGSQVTVTSVSVSNGLFTVTLDFGASAFAGSKRWLEVGARPGGSGGAFTTLSPRQELTPTPNAAYSATTGDTSVQRRTVAPTCPAGQYVQSLAADGTPTCASDTNSGGTVQTVATGAGLTGGPISVSGTVSVATGGITSTMIANGAVGSAQINQAQVQARVSGACPVGQYLRGINADGSAVCEPTPWVATAISSVIGTGGLPGGVPSTTSIAIGNDNLPVVSHPRYDSATTTFSVRVTHCGNAGCSAGNTQTTVDDPANSVGAQNALAIGSDNLPVISYGDATAGTLKVAHCGDAACSPATLSLATVDDPVNSVGAYSSIATGTDGLPVISYYDSTAGALKVAHCGNTACSAGNTMATVDDSGASVVGQYTSIAIGSDGLPIISYRDVTAGALKVAHCGTMACNSGNTITTVDNPANSVGQFTSIAIGTDNLPVISYYDLTGTGLKVAHCGNATCTSGNTIATVDPGGVVGEYTSIAIGSDGLPVISYYGNALKVAHCGNAACTAGNTITDVDESSTAAGQFTSIAIATDGLPIISYYDGSVGSYVRVAKCGTRTCQ